MGAVVHYDDTAKINAAYLYAACGNYSKVARDTGINRNTIMAWARDSGVWVESLGKAQQEINDEILAHNLELVVLSNEEIKDRVQNGDYVLKGDKLVRVPMKGRDLAVVSGIKEDKARVALGQATSITASHDNKTMLEACKELSRTMRGYRVVSVQEKSEEIEQSFNTGG